MNAPLTIIGSMALITLVVWWFLMKPSSDAVSAQVNGNVQTATIKVSGGYTPNHIQLKQGVAATLIFHRTDPSSCLKEVVLPDFGVHADLPLNKDYVVKINPDQPGRYTYTCGMSMYFGEITIK